jgi:CIC family chloride channel protein
MFEFIRELDGGILRWVLLILPAIGGLVGGIIVFKIAPEAEGHGTDAAIEAYHFKDGAVRTRVPFVKAIASMITIGTGGSAGREGPIAQIGSGFGSMLGRWVKAPPHERRILMVSGMAAGIGAIFHAPLAGALFAAEVFYRDPDFEHEVLVPGFISSIIAYSIFGTIFGFHALFGSTGGLAFEHVGILLPYLILALVSAAGAALYVKVFYGFRSFMFTRVNLPDYLKPAIGGVLVGIIGFFLPEALGAGYGVVQMCFDGEVLSLPSAATFQSLLPDGISTAGAAASLLAVIGLAKILTTAFSVGSGGSGGVFGPAVVIGGAFGGATGLICQQWFPDLGVQPGAFTLVGMAGFFAGAANTPVSTIIMVSEMTGNYNLLLPSMLVCIVSYGICKRINLYEKQLRSRLDAPSKLGNMASAILRRLTVHQALARRIKDGLTTIPQAMGFRALVARFTDSTQACFPVVDQNEKLTGMIDAVDIRRIVTEAGIDDLIIASDIAKPASTVTSEESLLAAINKMMADGSHELVVVDAQDATTVVGTLSRGDIISTYNRQIAGTPGPL